jgi:hypothetical protein
MRVLHFYGKISQKQNKKAQLLVQSCLVFFFFVVAATLTNL